VLGLRGRGRGVIFPSPKKPLAGASSMTGGAKPGLGRLGVFDHHCYAEPRVSPFCRLDRFPEIHDNNFDITDRIHWTSPHDWMAFIPVGALSSNFNTICDGLPFSAHVCSKSGPGAFGRRAIQRRDLNRPARALHPGIPPRGIIPFRWATSSRHDGRHHSILVGTIISLWWGSESAARSAR
jgi:hypothetical protein